MIPVTIISEGVEKPLYVLRDSNTKFIIRARTISNTPDLPSPGPDQEYLPIFTDELPTFDPDFQKVVRVEGPNESTLQWEIVLTVEDKTKEEQFASVDAAKRAQVPLVVPTQTMIEDTTIALAGVINQSKFTFTPEEQLAVDALMAQGAKLIANRAKAVADKLIIDAGGKPDLKGGWADPTVVAADVIPVVVVP